MVLKYLNIQKGVEIHHQGDLPARTGMGSSSSFVVGLLNSLYGLKEKMRTNDQLAREAIYVERQLLKETVGSQDQVATAFGGLNKITFHHDHSFTVKPIIVEKERKQNFQDHLMPCFTSFSRFAFQIAPAQVNNMNKRERELKLMYEMVDEGISMLTSNDDLAGFGRMLDEAWQYKRQLADNITTPKVDEIYAEAKKAGVLGGKLLGISQPFH